jgi:hypothetical protein
MTRSAIFRLSLSFILILSALFLADTPLASAQSASSDLIEAKAGETLDLHLTGVDSNFNSSTTILFDGANGCDEPDVIINNLDVLSTTSLTVNITIKATTTCLSNQDAKTRATLMTIYENGFYDPVGIYPADNELDIKNTTIEIGNLNPLGFTAITDGINDALPGDTVLVDAGEYHEMVDLNKNNITVKSKYGPASTTIIYDNPDYTVLMDNSNGSAIDGFSIKANADKTNAGIFIDSTSDHAISNMVFGTDLTKDLKIIGSSNSADSNLVENNIFRGASSSLDMELGAMGTTTFRGNAFESGASISDVSASPLGAPDLSKIFSANFWGDASGPASPIFNRNGSGTALATGIFFKDWCNEQSCATLTDVSLQVDNISALFANPGAYASNWFLRAPEGVESSSTPTLTALQQLVINIPTSGASSTVIIPEGTVIKRADGNDFDASSLSSAATEIQSLSGFDNQTAVGQAIQWGLPGIALTFNKPISISLYIGSGFEGRTLNILHSNSTSSDWNTAGLSSPTCTVSSGYCRFTTTRASYFSTTITNTQNNNNSGGGGTVIIFPLASPQAIATSTGSSSPAASVTMKPPVIAPAAPIKTTVTPPKLPKKLVLGQKIFNTATLLRDTKSKRIYIIIGDGKRAVRTIQELRQKYFKVRIYDLPSELLTKWKDVK